MNKISLALLTALTLTTTQADYMIKIPLEQNQGGSLPSGTVTIKNITPQAPIENWMPTTPFYTEWVNDGEPFDCTNWSPDPITVALGETFTQTATNCSQRQTRNGQDKELDTATGNLRDKGNPYLEDRVISVPSTRDSIGSLIPANVSDKECFAYNHLSKYRWVEEKGTQESFYLALLNWNGQTYLKNSSITGYRKSGGTDTLHYGLVFDGEIILEGYRYTRGVVASVASQYGICRESLY